MKGFSLRGIGARVFVGSMGHNPSQKNTRVSTKDFSPRTTATMILGNRADAPLRKSC
jgi:hypothetical protein